MASKPSDRRRFQTDKQLLQLAQVVPIFPRENSSVFYAEDDGAKLAERFVTRNRQYARLDELMQLSRSGMKLWDSLTTPGNPWSVYEEIWWELSWRLARAAKGNVYVFGPKRLIEDRPLGEYRHKYATGAYANTVFEKVELPELETNSRVNEIFYNGEPFK